MQGIVFLVTIALLLGCGGKGGDKGSDAFGLEDAGVEAVEATEEAGAEEALAVETLAEEGPETGLDVPLEELAALDLGPECTPSCEGKACGDDGCGGTCGQCPDGSECKDGQCKAQCVGTGGTGFSPKEKDTTWKPMYGLGDPRGYLNRVEATSNTYPLSWLSLEIRQHKPWNGPLGPGTYSFAKEGYQECKVCLRLADMCGENGCVHVYLATQGTIEIKQLSGADGPFEAVLHDVVLSEVKITIDQQTQQYKTTFVNKGKTWCLDGYEMGPETPTLLVPKPECVPEGTGTMQDQNIADFKLKNCLGHDVSIHSLCGKVGALWMVLVANWCPACAEWTPIAQKEAAKYGSKVALWFVVGEDSDGGVPDLADCKWFADKHGLDYGSVFIDPGYQTVAQHIYLYGFQGIPYNIVLDGKNMAYFWSDGLMGYIGSVVWYLAGQ